MSTQLDRRRHAEDVFVSVFALLIVSLFVVGMFFLFVGWAGPWAGGVGSPEVGKATLMDR